MGVCVCACVEGREGKCDGCVCVHVEKREGMCDGCVCVHEWRGGGACVRRWRPEDAYSSKCEKVVSQLILDSSEETDNCLTGSTPSRIDINHYKEEGGGGGRKLPAH